VIPSMPPFDGAGAATETRAAAGEAAK